MKENIKKIWIVAAGSGGHIFPGLAIARELKARVPDLEIVFFGTKDRLEEKIIPKYSYPIVFLRAKQWKGRGILDRVFSIWELIKSTFQVWKLIPVEKPNALISVGGYVSMPLGLACWLRRVPLFLVEPNIRAGIANKILSRMAMRAFTVQGSDALQKFHCPTEDTGNPVLGYFKVNPIRKEAKNLLILGGSQGARILCHVGLNAFSRLKNRGLVLNLILQSGDKNLEDALEIKKNLKLGEECQILPFMDDMASKLEWADVVIARAGAMTLSELSLAQVPSILVPFPQAADDHQRVNARMLVQGGAALMVDEKEKDFEKKLEDQIFSLLGVSDSFERRSAIAQQLATFARPGADKKIASEILSGLC